MAPSTPVAGDQFRTHHHQKDGGGQDYDDSHRQPQAGVPFAVNPVFEQFDSGCDLRVGVAL